MRVEHRWKDKAGEFLPEQGSEELRDMRVEVVHFDEVETIFLENWKELKQDPFSRRAGFTAKDGRIHVQILCHPYEEGHLTFSEALEFVKKGMAIQRFGWNGKNLIVRAQFPDEHSKMTVPYLYIEYPDGERCPWVASQTDIMAEDWRVL